MVRRIALENLNVQRVADRGGHHAPYIDTWAGLLGAPRARLLEAVTSPDGPACMLRSSSPFGGPLAGEERLAVLQLAHDEGCAAGAW